MGFCLTQSCVLSFSYHSYMFFLFIRSFFVHFSAFLALPPHSPPLSFLHLLSLFLPFASVFPPLSSIDGQSLRRLIQFLVYCNSLLEFYPSLWSWLLRSSTICFSLWYNTERNKSTTYGIYNTTVSKWVGKTPLRKRQSVHKPSWVKLWCSVACARLVEKNRKNELPRLAGRSGPQLAERPFGVFSSTYMLMIVVSHEFVINL